MRSSTRRSLRSSGAVPPLPSLQCRVSGDRQKNSRSSCARCCLHNGPIQSAASCSGCSRVPNVDSVLTDLTWAPAGLPMHIVDSPRLCQCIKLRTCFQ